MHVKGKNLDGKQPERNPMQHAQDIIQRQNWDWKDAWGQGTKEKLNGFRRMSRGRSELFPDASQNCWLDPESGSVLGTHVTITTINK